MGSDDYVEVYDYVFKEVFKRDVAFVDVLDGLAFGFHKRGEPYTLQRIREQQRAVGNTETMLIGGCGYDVTASEAAVESGDADAVCIGRPLISNPNLVEKFKNKEELVEPD